MCKLGFFSFLFLFSIAQAKQDLRVVIQPEIQKEMKAGEIQYKFKLHDSKTKKYLTDKDLVETHTKILHFIAYDAAKKEFNHVHPEFKDKMWTVNLNFAVNGDYFFWAQGELKDETAFSIFIKTKVVGGNKENPIETLKDIRTVTKDRTVLTIDPGEVQSGKMVMLNFKITRDDGKSPAITPYLGAFAHVIAVSPRGNDLIHVHPMQSEKPNTGMIHATFPIIGVYRIWVEMMDHGVVKSMPVSIAVSK